jgi:hypothetical protein
LRSLTVFSVDIEIWSFSSLGPEKLEQSATLIFGKPTFNVDLDLAVA